MADGQVWEWWKLFGPAGGSLVLLELPLPRPFPADDVRAAVETVVARHDALRTMFEFDDRGFPRQVVHPAGERSVRFEEAHDSVDRQDPDLVKLLWRGQIHVEQDWPAWACLFRTDDGLVTEVDLVLSHLVIDAVGTAVIKREVAEFLMARRAGRPVRLPPVERHLLDVVELEAAPQVRHDREAAEEYWREQIRTSPNRNFVSRDHAKFRLYSGTLTSTTAPHTLAAAARRFRSTPAALYSALVGALLAAVSGTGRATLRMHYHGRSVPAESVVGCFHRILFTTVDVRDEPSLSKIFKRAATETLRAQRRYRIPWTRLKELEATETLRRGTGFAEGTTVNFDIVDSYEDDYLRAGGDLPGTLTAPSPTVLLNPAEFIDGGLGLEAYLMPRLGVDRLIVTGAFDGDVLRPAEMEALLRGPEVLLFEALQRGDLTFAGLTDVMAGHGWSARAPVPTVENSPLDIEYVRETLTEHPEVVAAHPRIDRADGRDRLMAFVATTGDRLRPRDLREFLLARVSSSSSLMCPEYFVVCAGGPERRDDTEAWSRLPRIAEGSGRDRPAASPGDERERVLWQCVSAFNDIGEPDLTRTYLEAGAGLLVVPALLRRVAELGFAGLVPDDFLRPVPLARLAERLKPRR